MSFGGPPPASAPPSGPFEDTITKIASSPYTMATAIFLINVGGRFLPMEISKEQEKFLNQPWFRRSIIFVILFLATRNFITAGWMALIIILLIGYLFNENSDLYLFSKGPGVKQTVGDTVSLTSEEQLVLKTLQDKAMKIQDAAAKPIKLNPYKGAEKHKQYKNILRSLWNQISPAN
jgi:hypothetical protein